MPRRWDLSQRGVTWAGTPGRRAARAAGEEAEHGLESLPFLQQQGRIKPCTSGVCRRLICSNDVRYPLAHTQILQAL